MSFLVYCNSSCTIMSLGSDTNSSTDKQLTLPKLPCKPKESTKLLTPPLRPSISVPFQWEEAPGRPRATPDEAASPLAAAAENSTNFKKEAAACTLNLPPRLLWNDDAGITMTPSKTTVLHGPCVGRSLSLACSFSFRKGPIAGRGDGLRPTTKNEGRKFGSGRWGSFKAEEGKFAGRGSFDFLPSLCDAFGREKNVKIARVRRKRSFFPLSSMNSNLWADIYASFREAVPWRRRT